MENKDYITEYDRRQQEDMEEYFRLAKCAEDHGEEELAFYLNMIAKDEKSHADYLHKYLKKHGYEHKKEHL